MHLESLLLVIVANVALAKNVTVFLNDTRLAYQGSYDGGSWGDEGNYNPSSCGGWRMTAINDSSVSLVFTGVAVTINFIVGKRGSNSTVLLDDSTFQRISTYNQDHLYTDCVMMPVRITNLTNKLHNVTAVNLSTNFTHDIDAMALHSFVYTTPSSQSDSTIIGGVFGTLSGIIIAGILVFLGRKHYRRRKQTLTSIAGEDVKPGHKATGSGQPAEKSTVAPEPPSKPSSHFLPPLVVSPGDASQIVLSMSDGKKLVSHGSKSTHVNTYSRGSQNAVIVLPNGSCSAAKSLPSKPLPSKPLPSLPAGHGLKNSDQVGEMTSSWAHLGASVTRISVSSESRRSAQSADLYAAPPTTLPITPNVSGSLFEEHTTAGIQAIPVLPGHERKLVRDLLNREASTTELKTVIKLMTTTSSLPKSIKHEGESSKPALASTLDHSVPHRLHLHSAPEDERLSLDLVFVQDCTSSQAPYISSAIAKTQEICTRIFESGKLERSDDLRVGLVAFRDHPPQDRSYVTQNFGFSSDINVICNNLLTLSASGGGDGPEAVTAALAETLTMDWRDRASKMVVLITDAPPHGIGELGDGFSLGSPDGHDPLELARVMASRGITLFLVACEPTLSSYYRYATDFYKALTSITSGLVLPLVTADLLAQIIIGSVLENLDVEYLMNKIRSAVVERILGNNENLDDVAQELHNKLFLQGKSSKDVVESIYKDSPEARHNVSVFVAAPSLAQARPRLKRVPGGRLTEKYSTMTH